MSAVTRGLVVGLFLFLGAVSGAGAQLRDLTIGSRALTDADMEKLVAVTREVAIARQGIPKISSQEGIAQLRAATVKAADKQGWGTLDYSVVSQRMNAASMLIKMEATQPAPAEKKADVELARRWKGRWEEAKAGKAPER